MDTENINTTGEFWRSEMLRLTLFPSEPIKGETMVSFKWWEDATGLPPENRNIQPRLNSIEEQGVVENGKANLILQLKPERIDWLVTPILTKDFDFSEIPNLGLFNDSIDLFSKLINPWLKKIPIEVQRIALGAKLIGNVEDKKSGYQKLEKYLPKVEIDAENSSDFSYSINRPKQIVVSSKTIPLNRLSKWTFSANVFLKIETESETIRNANIKHNVCNLELDVNTQQDLAFKFLSDDCDKIFNSLIQNAKEIALKGDIL